MLGCRFVCVHCLLGVILMHCLNEASCLAVESPESFDSYMATDTMSQMMTPNEKSVIDYRDKLLLLDELASLENDAIEMKRKRSFNGFGTPIDKISAKSLDNKNKQRKVVDLPKRRFGVPLDRIGANRLSNSRG
ncbi:osteocrin [Protopterus annectens]|uniref:osteocrin n=1 Tax=Protopterus annectens TaxID=7888 RepID=UPI001CF9DA5F|nr:osteocrin [Protopterus annectens]